jgi:hypothetical protein
MGSKNGSSMAVNARLAAISSPKKKADLIISPVQIAV